MAQPGGDGPDPLVGQVLDGRYRVERYLGGGGMGRVYDATQVELGRRVALKVLIPELARNPSILERFRREAVAAAILGHPHIVDVTDFVIPQGGPPFLVMEHLVGEALMDVLTRDGKLSIPRALRITVQLLDALQTAHEAGIVHRDLKPANVFLVALAGDDEMVKLLDFGIAKLRDPGSQKLTAVGEMVGTPRFAAPEQLTGGTVDARADIYGAGILLYGMLTGQPPFNASMADLVRQVLEEDPVDPRVMNPEVDPILASIVARAMAKRPEDRFQTAKEMLDALGGRRAKGADEADDARLSVAQVAGAQVAGAQAAGGAATPAQSPSTAPRPPKSGGGRLLLVVAALAGLAVLLAAGVGLAAYQLGSSTIDDAAPMIRSADVSEADVAAAVASCEEFVEASCACPGEHRSELCESARTSVLSLRRSVEIGATSAETAGEWCRSMVASDTLCWYEGPALTGELDEGVQSGVITASDATREDGGHVHRYGLQLDPTQRVEIWMQSESLDPYLVLRDPGGRVVAVNDDAGPRQTGDAAQIEHFPRQAGRYVVEAGGASAQDQGPYELIVELGQAPSGERSPPRRGRRRRGASSPAMPEPWTQDGDGSADQRNGDELEHRRARPRDGNRQRRRRNAGDDDDFGWF